MERAAPAETPLAVHSPNLAGLDNGILVVERLRGPEL